MKPKHTETAGNKLHDTVQLLIIAENSAETDWVKISRVVRHALSKVQDDLCGECSYGDCVPDEVRVETLIARARQIQR